jgi:IS30 family transposase
MEKAPFVCNGCDKPRNKCHIANKYDYDAAFAHRKYEELLSSCREGINASKAQIRKMDEILNPLIAQGQSPYHILCSHPELNVSVKTLYNYIDKQVLLVRNIDLKRKVKFKLRKSEKKSYITERKVFIGRSYKDFKALGLSGFVEMDTVISAGDCLKCILTFYFTDTGLFLAFLLNRCTQGAVRAVFDRLEGTLGTYEFLSLFENILTDRGSEFGDPDSLETGIYGIQRTSIYYCDPMSSGQKGGIEEAHTLLRMVLPKKTVFTDLTQWDLRKIVNHINSYSRERLRGKTPYQCALEKYGDVLLNKMQLKPIDPDEINLTPKLLKK